MYTVCVHFQATQKGDPVAMLKKQLEDREKQLAAEQEDASAAKNRLRELTKVWHSNICKPKSYTVKDFLHKNNILTLFVFLCNWFILNVQRVQLISIKIQIL